MVAQDHAAWMASNNNLSHGNDGALNTRLREANYPYVEAGENIAHTSYITPVERVMELWVDSPRHCQNVVRNSYWQVGIGAADSEYGRFWCVLFGTPSRPYPLVKTLYLTEGLRAV